MRLNDRMKKSLLYIIALLALASCVKEPATGPDSGDDSESTVAANEWIDKYLSDWYLWREDMTGKTRDYDLGYNEFFESLLSRSPARNDGYPTGDTYHYYSRVFRDEVIKVKSGAISVNASETPEKDFGFDFSFPVPWFINKGTMTASRRVYCMVLYVVPGSTADGKLKRGDMIFTINGQDITYENIFSLYPLLLPESQTGQQAGQVTVRVIRPTLIGRINDTNEPVYDYESISPTITLAPQSKDPNPVLLSKVLTAANGDKIGYLAYQRFVSGFPEFTDKTYSNELKAIIAGWKGQNVKEVILDLRYNGGGDTNVAWLLTSMLAPAAESGRLMMTEKRNSLVKSRYYGGSDYVLNFLPVNQMNASVFGTTAGANLDLERLYVLSSERTASSSELVMGCLKGVGVQVINIGARTTGKNVGADYLSNEYRPSVVTDKGIFKFGGKSYQFTLAPITFICYNARGDLYVPDEGFSPDYEIYEEDRVDLMPDLGEEDEPMLSLALHHIDNGVFSAPQRVATAPKPTRIVSRSSGNFSAPAIRRPSGMVQFPDIYKDFPPIK